MRRKYEYAKQTVGLKTCQKMNRCRIIRRLKNKREYFITTKKLLRKLVAAVLALAMIFAITMPIVAADDDDSGLHLNAGCCEVEDDEVLVEVRWDPISCTGLIIIGWAEERIYGPLLPCGNREVIIIHVPIWGTNPNCPACNPPVR